MARQFRRTPSGIEGWLHGGEAELLRDLARHMVDLLDGRDRADPAAARLFPDAYREDDASTREFRRLVEDDLRETKRQAARTLAQLTPETNGFVLDDETAEQWLLALNDMRLALGARLGVTEDEERPEDERYQLYDFLTMLQASLIDALT